VILVSVVLADLSGPGECGTGSPEWSWLVWYWLTWVVLVSVVLAHLSDPG